MTKELFTSIRECGISLSQIDYLLLTHIHLDHAGGTREFLERCESSTAFIPERGLKHMIEPEILNSSARSVLGDRIFEMWGRCDPVPKERSTSVKAYDSVDLGDINLKYLPAPGHAPHHNVLFDEANSTVFSADALGIYDQKSGSIIPTTPPPSFDLEKAIEDIEMIRNLNPRLACMAHFAEMYSDDNYFEEAINRFKKWAQIIELYVGKNNLTTYNLDNCQEIYSILIDNWPEYRGLAGDLKEQIVRVDVAGLLNYIIKRRRSQLT